ncbi:hypothetical protein D3C71_1454380 [compost metagenome]
MPFRVRTDITLLRFPSPAASPAISAAERDLISLVARGILQVFDDKRAGGQLIQAVCHSLLTARYDATNQRGVLAYVHQKTAVTRFQPRLLCSGLEIAVHPALRDISGDGAFAVAVNANAGLNAGALLLGIVGAGVLQRLDSKILADRGDDLICAGCCADQNEIRCQTTFSGKICLKLQSDTLF